jgi:hypothetical protein
MNNIPRLSKPGLSIDLEDDDSKLKSILIKNNIHLLIKEYCTQSGLKISNLVEKALLDYIKNNNDVKKESSNQK